MGVSSDNDEANTSSRRPQGKLRSNTSTQVLQWRLFLNTSIGWQWKLWSGIQVSKLVQRKLHSGMCTSTQGKIFLFYFFIFFNFFLNQSEFEGNGVEEME